MSSLPRLCLAALAALLIVVPTALAAEEGETERPEYVAKLEPICAANTKANSRILKGVKAQVNKGKLVPAGKRFVRAAGAFGHSVAQMGKVPKPSSDMAKLNTWFGYLSKEKKYLLEVGRALKAKNKYRAEKVAQTLNKNGQRANNTVISFGFKECRIESSRFL